MRVLQSGYTDGELYAVRVKIFGGKTEHQTLCKYCEIPQRKYLRNLTLSHFPKQIRDNRFLTVRSQKTANESLPTVSYTVRFQILTTLLQKAQAFWHITLC
jgi:S-adenosylmethionine:tRNA-ribosyltransferase-isomerase (queuine synthetase)